MTKVTQVCLSLVISLFLCAIAFGQHRTPLMKAVDFAKKTTPQFQKTDLFQLNGSLQDYPEIRSGLAKGTILKIDETKLISTANKGFETMEFVIPRDGESPLVLELVQKSPLADGFRVTTSRSNGEAVDYTPGVHYRGVVKNVGRSLAAVSIFEDRVMAVLAVQGIGNVVLGKLGPERGAPYILYAERDILFDQNFECGTDHLPETHRDIKKFRNIANANAPENNTVNCVNVYFECEHDMYNEHGSVAATTAHMEGIFNAVSTIYSNDAITTAISEIFVWDTPDSYPTSSTVDALNAFRDDRPTFNGDVAHLISRGAPSGGGVAWVDALCTSFNYAYSWINSTYEPFPTYSWTVEVVTHEMGHNLASPHTHACAWNGNNTAIDGCGPEAGYSEGCDGPLPAAGTIMSYCHLVSGIGIDFNLGFGVQPRDLIQNAIDNASCLGSCGPPCTLTVDVTGTDANGGNNGTATATPSGGTPPYTYAWSNGGTTQTITGLAPGTYSVTVDDDGGCTVTGSVVINDVTPCPDNELTLTIVLDNYPEETSWEVKDAGGNVVASSGGTYANEADGATVVEDLCLPDACYDFIIYDSYGDGICCAYGIGSYSLEDDSGNVLASGGQFGSSETTNFCVPQGGGQTYNLTTSVGSGAGSVNPSGGTYNAGDQVVVTATPDAGYQFDNWTGDISSTDNPVTITMNSNMNLIANFSSTGGGGCTYELINFNNFDSGWGIWNDGGSDCRRSTKDAAWAYSGNRPVRLRDNTSTSTATTDNLNLAAYDELTVDFTYIARSMDNANEDFWLQISTNGGSTFTTVEEWNEGDEFENDVREFDVVVIPGPFTSTTQLRFRCDASGNSDWVYIDDVEITGCLNSNLNGPGTGILVDAPGKDDNSVEVIQTAPVHKDIDLNIYPNPVNSELTVSYKTESEEDVQLIIMDFTGQIVQIIEVGGGEQTTKVNVSDLNTGSYVMRMIAGQNQLVKKFVVIK